MGRASRTDHLSPCPAGLPVDMRNGRRATTDAFAFAWQYQRRASGGAEPYSAGNPRGYRRLGALARVTASIRSAADPRLDMAGMLSPHRNRPAQLSGELIGRKKRWPPHDVETNAL